MEPTHSKTIINKDGKIIFFGLEQFLDDIAKGECCFICGAKPDSKEFNDEHVIPNWILRKYHLHGKYITLPNGTKFAYGQYKVPCCSECNSELGDIYEKPISILLNKTYNEIVADIKQNPRIMKLLSKWLSLIFIKTHLKDKSLLVERNRRINKGFLADNYYWEDMHHIHCIARSHYTGAQIDNSVYGTLFILPSLIIGDLGRFDYVDSHLGKVIMLQLGKFSIISVLNDSCAGLTFFRDRIEKINAPLSQFQLREIVAHLSFINLNLKERPVFYSDIKHTGKYQIKANVPEVIFLKKEEDRIVSPGEFLRYYVEDMIGDIENKEQILSEIENNKRNYLFDEKGEFIKNNE